MPTFCFDIDGTLCTKVKNYKKAKPIKQMINRVNDLYDMGNKIILNTARGKSSGKNWEQLTINQLEIWGVKYHNIYFTKPAADYYIDDKAVTISDFLLGNYGG